ncbi:hypothetical protein H257_12398 [Aphanomyces astaci]|uniref:Uncharacterized protein n=1 Tax=Aphanomyces astaci TaxID=112090 RepID=W4FYV1_APHAT|nr:hypothetical protein H257_12398 [Aphanomyces astaci]ETV72650.1 hypothetical protein H257_12398 [Aphanomyces astaci]|eukprot:XP_009837878.1 hypothetical protein H257_12398 [Aphanomyces astaci]
MASTAFTRKKAAIAPNETKDVSNWNAWTTPTTSLSTPALCHTTFTNRSNPTNQKRLQYNEKSAAKARCG